MLLHAVAVQLCLCGKHDKLVRPTCWEGAEIVLLLKVLFQVLIVLKVLVVVWVLAAADVAVVVVLLHVLELLCLVVKVGLAEATQKLHRIRGWNLTLHDVVQQFVCVARHQSSGSERVQCSAPRTVQTKHTCTWDGP